MPRAILIVWWIGLVGALAATLAILKQVDVILRALRDIHRLGEVTRDAAHGVARNVAAISKLAAVAGPSDELREATRSLAAAARELEHRVAELAVPAKTPSRGG